MSFQSTLNSTLVPDLALPNGLQYIVDNDKSDGLAGQILSSNNGGGLLWINGGGSGGGNVSTNIDNEFTASNSFVSTDINTAFTVSVPNVLFTTAVEFSDTIQPQSILDDNGDSGTAGQVITAGIGGQVIWATPSSGGGNVSTETINTFTETNIFNNNIGAGVQLQVNVPSFFSETITGNLAGNISGTAIAIANGAVGSVLYQNAVSSTAGLGIGQEGDVLYVANTGIPSWSRAMQVGSDFVNLTVPYTTTFNYTTLVNQDIGFTAVYHPANATGSAGSTYNFFEFIMPSQGVWTFTLTCVTVAGTISLGTTYNVLNPACQQYVPTGSGYAASISYTIYADRSTTMYGTYGGASSYVNDIYLTYAKVA